MLLKTLRCIHCDSIETNDFKYINLNDMNFWCSLCSKWNNIINSLHNHFIISNLEKIK